MAAHSADELRQHAHDLARAFKVVLAEVAGMKHTPESALAVPVVSMVFVAPITDETTYVVALHELGHVVAPLGAIGGNDNLTREAEDAAWAWARHYALEWTPLMEHVATWARQTYDAPLRRADPPAPEAPIEPIDWETW